MLDDRCRSLSSFAVDYQGAHLKPKCWNFQGLIGFFDLLRYQQHLDSSCSLSGFPQSVYVIIDLNIEHQLSVVSYLLKIESIDFSFSEQF